MSRSKLKGYAGIIALTLALSAIATYILRLHGWAESTFVVVPIVVGLTRSGRRNGGTTSGPGSGSVAPTDHTNLHQAVRLPLCFFVAAVLGAVSAAASVLGPASTAHAAALGALGSAAEMAFWLALPTVLWRLRRSHDRTTVLLAAINS